MEEKRLGMMWMGAPNNLPKECFLEGVALGILKVPFLKEMRSF